MAKITIHGQGEFEIRNECIQELMNWLSQHAVVQTNKVDEANRNVRYSGQQLING